MIYRVLITYIKFTIVIMIENLIRSAKSIDLNQSFKNIKNNLISVIN